VPVTDQEVPVTDQKVQDNRPLAEIRAEIAEERAQQDAQDIDRIVQSVTKEIQNHYPNIKNCILYIYGNDPKYKGNKELGAILRWYFLLPAQNCYERQPKTNLCRQRESIKIDLDEEVKDAQKKNPTIPMLELLTNIEMDEMSFIATIMRNITVHEEAMKDRQMVNTMLPYAINDIARIVYYYEFKDALLRSKK